MKILFIGDYSNLHACLAKSLRSSGHDVTVVSDRCGHMQTDTDIYIDRKPGLKGAVAYLMQLIDLIPSLKGYDAVQLINSNFLSLRPEKIRFFYNKLSKQNGGIFLSLAGDDYYFVKACAEGRIFRFSEYKIGDRPTEMTLCNPERMEGWISLVNREWSSYLYERIDGAMSVLPEYDMAARHILGDRLHFTNLPVDLETLPYSPLPNSGRVKLLVGIRNGMEVQKGTLRLLETARAIEREHPDLVEVSCVRNLPLTEYLDCLKKSDIVLDQLYSYSPATNALQTMALGRLAASGAQPEFYEYIGNPEARPVICLDPVADDIKERLCAIVRNRGEMHMRSMQGRRLVEENNDVGIVADRFLQVWQNRKASV